MISSVLLSKEKIDQALKLNKIKGCQSLNYLWLRSNSSYQKLQGLNLNDILNCEVRFERLISVNETSTATYEGATEILRDVMKK